MDDDNIIRSEDVKEDDFLITPDFLYKENYVPDAL